MVTSVTSKDEQLGFISKLKVERWKMAVAHGMHLFHPDPRFVVSAQCVSKVVRANLL